ncbi:MAG: hypothetical protein ABL999_04405 [Pyrinomonadaceae bacterium]
MARYDFLSCRRQRQVRVYEALSPAFAGSIDETALSQGSRPGLYAAVRYADSKPTI